MQVAKDSNGNTFQAVKPVSTEALSISAVAASAAAFGSTTNVIRIVSLAACWYSLEGTATTSSVYLPAATVEYIRITPGDTLSVIAGGASTAYISECI